VLSLWSPFSRQNTARRERKRRKKNFETTLRQKKSLEQYEKKNGLMMHGGLFDMRAQALPFS
jgi:hypothetical protein